jgi:uncharacterized protein YbcI
MPNSYWPYANTAITREVIAMRTVRHELEQEICDVFSNFFQEQLGEHTTSVQVFLCENILTVRALNYLAPGEQQLAQHHQHWKLLQEIKTLEFIEVKHLLVETLETVISCEVLDIYSLFGQDGVRFEVVTLGDNLEKKLLKLKEIEP